MAYEVRNTTIGYDGITVIDQSSRCHGRSNVEGVTGGVVSGECERSKAGPDLLLVSRATNPLSVNGPAIATRQRAYLLNRHLCSGSHVNSYQLGQGAIFFVDRVPHHGGLAGRPLVSSHRVEPRQGEGLGQRADQMRFFDTSGSSTLDGTSRQIVAQQSIQDLCSSGNFKVEDTIHSAAPRAAASAISRLPSRTGLSTDVQCRRSTVRLSRSVACGRDRPCTAARRREWEVRATRHSSVVANHMSSVLMASRLGHTSHQVTCVIESCFVRWRRFLSLGHGLVARRVGRGSNLKEGCQEFGTCRGVGHRAGLVGKEG